MMNSSQQQQQQQQQQEETILRAIVVSTSISCKIGGQPISTHDRQVAFQVLTDFRSYDGRIPMALAWLQRTDQLFLLGEEISIPTKLYALDILHDFTKERYASLNESERLALRQTVLTAARQHASILIRSVSSSSSSQLQQQATSPIDDTTNTTNNTTTNTTANANVANEQTRIVANKIASLLAAFLVRDFPQRWTTLMNDMFTPMQQGGLWYDPTSSDNNTNNINNNNNGNNSHHDGTEQPIYTMGVKICLECLKLVAENCTDSDFNSKISTKRRNDILIGLNEVSSQFLPQIFRLLEYVTKLMPAKANLHQMRSYLIYQHEQQQQQQHQNSSSNPQQQQQQQQQSLSSIQDFFITPPQLAAYLAEQAKVIEIGSIVSDTMATVEKFCRSMPLDWIFSSPQQDMTTAFYHMLRETTAGIQLLAVECLEQLTLRGKFTYSQWMRVLSELRAAIPQANQQFATEQEYASTERTWVLLVKQTLPLVRSSSANTMVANNAYTTLGAMSNPQDQTSNPTDHLCQQLELLLQQSTSLSTLSAILETPLTVQFEFHKGLSRMLTAVVSSHIAHITVDKKILGSHHKHSNQCTATTPEATTFSSFLRLLVDILHHPCGRICGEQINMWIALLRDPQITRTNLLQPYLEEVLSCYIDHVTRIRWDDVESQIHPQTSLMEASWDDEEEYEGWIGDIRSRASQLFKFIGNAEPQIAASVLLSRIQSLVTSHGNGQPLDHLHPSNQQLTQNSESVRLFEGMVQPLETVLCGLPSWSLQLPSGRSANGTIDHRNNNNGNDSHKLEKERVAIRDNVRRYLAELAQIVVVQWNPPYLWLKFRRAQLLDGLKHYWKYDPSTLLQGIDCLLGYLRAPDEWSNNTDKDGSIRLSDETIGLRKKSSSALVAVSKHNPHHLVPWLSQLSDATRSIFSSEDLLPTNRMHLHEFLSCVANAVEDPTMRANFIADVLADAISIVESREAQESLSSVESFLAFVGVAQAKEFPGSVTDLTNVRTVTARFARLFSAFNQLLSVGKRCHEAARKRPNGGIPMSSLQPTQQQPQDDTIQPIPQQSFPDEGPISIRDLSIDDPFVPLWPRILPPLLNALDVILSIWRPEHQAILLQDRIQRYAVAISDDEAYLSRRNDCKTGGVFGEGGTAGSVIPGTDRRDLNLAPRWTSWLTEFRNACFQLLGLFASQRVPFAPELSEIYPRFVATVVDPQNLRAMEHRHFTQYMKQFMELFLLSCPSTMYMTHVAPILGPVLEHVQYRLEKTWLPILGSGGTTPEMCKPLFTADCEAAAALASRGGDEWFASYYARAGIFVGDLDVVTAEAAVEKGRVEMTRTYSDVIQSALGLKGDWALVLANLAKEDQAKQRNDPSKLSQGPRNRLTEGQVNADGTPKSKNQAAIDARKLMRISAMCHFLFLEHEQIAGSLTMTVIQCLSYPDAYSCRRMTRICHRILETVAWYPRYTEILGNRMLSAAVRNIVTEPKWMVGVEWDMINVVRDLYGRLVLGQIVQPGGQGAGLQQPAAQDNPNQYEQAKTVDRPLQGGGVLTTPSDLPRQLLASLPGIGIQAVEQLDRDLKRKRSAKDQKDFIRDLLRIAADNCTKENSTFGMGNSGTSGLGLGVLDRAVEEESLLHNGTRKATVGDIPEKLVTHSMMVKKAKKKKNQADRDSSSNIQGLAAFDL